jgi:hypothetical protein
MKETRSICSLGCFPAAFSSGEGWAVCMNSCNKRAEESRSECYQRCVLRYKY